MYKIFAIFLIVMISGCSAPESKYFGNDILGLEIVGFDDMQIKTDNGVILNIFNGEIGILLNKTSVQFPADSIFSAKSDSLLFTDKEMQGFVNEKILSFGTTSTYEMSHLNFNSLKQNGFEGFYYTGARNADGINMLLGAATSELEPYKIVYFNISYLDSADKIVFEQILPSLRTR